MSFKASHLNLETDSLIKKREKAQINKVKNKKGEIITNIMKYKVIAEITMDKYITRR